MSDIIFNGDMHYEKGHPVAHTVIGSVNRPSQGLGNLDYMCGYINVEAYYWPNDSAIEGYKMANDVMLVDNSGRSFIKKGIILLRCSIATYRKNTPLMLRTHS